MSISLIYGGRGGTRLFKDLYTIVLLSCLIMSLTVSKPRFSIRGSLEEAKLIFVMKLAALF